MAMEAKKMGSRAAESHSATYKTLSLLPLVPLSSGIVRDGVAVHDRHVFFPNKTIQGFQFVEQEMDFVHADFGSGLSMDRKPVLTAMLLRLGVRQKHALRARAG